MIYKTYQVKTQEDYNELSEQDRSNLIIQYNKWLQDCPVKTKVNNMSECSSQNEPYPHRIETLDILVPLVQPVEEEKLKKYEVQYKIDVYGSVEVEAECEVEAEEIALTQHTDDIYDNIYLQDYDIEINEVFEVKKKKVA